MTHYDKREVKIKLSEIYQKLISVQKLDLKKLFFVGPESNFESSIRDPEKSVRTYLTHTKFRHLSLSSLGSLRLNRQVETTGVETV